MSIKLSIFIAFIIQSMFTNNFNNNGHDKALNLQRLSDEHLIVANSINMEHYKNLSLENIEGEIWKDITDYQGLYQVSNYGRIKSLNRIIYRNRLKKDIAYSLGCKIMKQVKGKRGYLVLALWNGNISKRVTAHRIIAKEFIHNTHNKPFINHIDLDKTNNSLNNLEWCTPKENIVHAHKNGAMPITYNKGKFGNESPLSKLVGQYDLNGNLIKVWESTKDAQRKQTGFKQTGVWKCCSGIRKQYKGFKWSYV